MSFRPLYDRVLVRRVESEERTSSGLFIPETAKEKPQAAQVVAVGQGRLNEKNELIPLSVKVGDRILFGKYAGDEIKIDGVDHLIFRESDILAVFES